MIKNKTALAIALISLMTTINFYGMEKNNPTYIEIVEKQWEKSAAKGLTGIDLLHDILIEKLPSITGISSKSKEKRIKEERDDITEALEALQKIKATKGFTPQDIPKLSEQVTETQRAVPKIMQKFDNQWPSEELPKNDGLPKDEWYKNIAQEAITLHKTNHLSLDQIITMINNKIDGYAKSKGKIIAYRPWPFGNTHKPLDLGKVNEIKEKLKKTIEPKAKETIELETQAKKPIDLMALWQAAKAKGFTSDQLLIHVLTDALVFDPTMAKEEKLKKYADIIKELEKIKSDTTIPPTNSVESLARKVLLARKKLNEFVDANDTLWPFNSVPTNEWNNNMALNVINITQAAETNLPNTVKMLPIIIKMVNQIIDQKAKTKGITGGGVSIIAEFTSLSSELVTQTKENLMKAIIEKAQSMMKPKPTATVPATTTTAVPATTPTTIPATTPTTVPATPTAVTTTPAAATPTAVKQVKQVQPRSTTRKRKVTFKKAKPRQPTRRGRTRGTTRRQRRAIIGTHRRSQPVKTETQPEAQSAQPQIQQTQPQTQPVQPIQQTESGETLVQ